MKRTLLSLLLTIIGIASQATANDFPIGMYAFEPSTDAHFQLIKSFGFDTVQLYTNPYADDWIQFYNDFFDRAQKAGMKVQFTFNMPKNQREEQKVDWAIKHFSKHPAFGFWYLADEPTGADKRKQLEQWYRRFKKATPNAKTAVCLAWLEDFPTFNNCSDILMPDIYPVQDKPFPQAPIRQLADFTWRVKRMGKDVMPIAQLNSIDAYPWIVKTNRYNPKLIRNPNAIEMRNYIFSCMVLDIKGMFFFSYQDLKRTNRMDWFKHVGGPAVAELRDFTNQIKGMTWESLTGKPGIGPLPKLTAARWSQGTKGFVVIANNTGQDLPGPFKLGLGSNPLKLRTWGATRQPDTSYSDGVIHLDKLSPWETMVWSFEQAQK